MNVCLDLPSECDTILPLNTHGGQGVDRTEDEDALKIVNQLTQHHAELPRVREELGELYTHC